MIVIMSPPIPHLRNWHSLPDPTFAPQPVFDLCKKCEMCRLDPNYPSATNLSVSLPSIDIPARCSNVLDRSD